MDPKNARTENARPLLEGEPPSGGKGVTSMTVTSPPFKPNNFNLFVATCICNLAAFSAGNALTWSSPTIPKLREQNAILPEQESWLGSLIACGASVGPFLAGALVDRIGRKTTLLLNSILFIVSWALLATGYGNYPQIYAARVVAGIGAGVCYTVTPMYIAEIAEDSLRGALGSLMAFFLCSGFLLEYIVGPFTSYLVLIVVSAVAPITFAFTFFFMPESPYYLLAKNEKGKALRALQWLRGAENSADVQKELSEMQASVSESQAQNSGMLELFATKGNIKALYLSCGLVSFQQLSGINVILFYSEPIFDQTGSGLSSSACTIFVGTVMIFAAGAAPPMAKWLGMKKLLILSAIGMAVCQGVLGLYFYLQKNNVDLSTMKLLPVACMVIYIIVYSLGFGPLPWAVMGEMFPANIKANASAFTAAFCWVLGFVITKSFDSIAELLGMDMAFWIFGGFCIVALLFTVILLPDTNGMSLQEIQDLLNGRQVSRTIKPGA